MVLFVILFAISILLLLISSYFAIYLFENSYSIENNQQNINPTKSYINKPYTNQSIYGGMTTTDNSSSDKSQDIIDTETSTHYAHEYASQKYPKYEGKLPAFDIPHYPSTILPTKNISGEKVKRSYTILIDPKISYIREIFAELCKDWICYSFEELQTLTTNNMQDVVKVKDFDVISKKVVDITHNTPDIVKVEDFGIVSKQTAGINRSLDFIFSMRFGSIDKTTGRWLGNKFGDITSKTQSHIKSFIGEMKKCIIDKNMLYKTMTEFKREELMARSIDLRDAKTQKLNKSAVDKVRRNISSGEIYILKPYHLGTQSGKGIYRIGDKLNTTNAVKQFDEFLKCDDLQKYYNMYVACEYITNVLLYQGKKFHLRVFMVIVCDGVGDLIKPTAKIYPNYRIRTAKNKYKTSEYENTYIHDTHAKDTIGSLDFESNFTPDDITNSNDKPLSNNFDELKQTVSRQIIEIGELMTAIAIKNKFRGFPDCERVYELFGLDILVRDDGSLILIECNQDPGVAPTDNELFGDANNDANKFVDFQYGLFKWMYETAILPMLEM
jgi:hypothetical protein